MADTFDTLELLQTDYKWIMLNCRLFSRLVLNLFISTYNVLNTTFRVRYLRLLCLPPDAEGNPAYHSVSIKITHALLLAKQ